LVDTFLGFAKNSFEKLQATTYRFSKEFSENLGKVLTNRMNATKIQKRIVQALSVFKRVLQIQKV
jgi:hypothetical protein